MQRREVSTAFLSIITLTVYIYEVRTFLGIYPQKAMADNIIIEGDLGDHIFTSPSRGKV